MFQALVGPVWRQSSCAPLVLPLPVRVASAEMDVVAAEERGEPIGGHLLFSGK